MPFHICIHVWVHKLCALTLTDHFVSGAVLKPSINATADCDAIATQLSNTANTAQVIMLCSTLDFGAMSAVFSKQLALPSIHTCSVGFHSKPIHEWYVYFHDAAG